MSSASETCGCGAKVTIDCNGDARLREALREWRSTHRHAEPTQAAASPEAAPEHVPDGNNFATTERNYDSAPHELNSESRKWWPAEGPYGRAISLKWSPPGE